MADKEQKHHQVHDEIGLVASIRNSESSDDVVQTTLRTDERVIARVTDGIYRQPASAIRELISNAYDADATRVVINTDAPRFMKISVEDNGHGMPPEVLAHLLLHIGGSAKRNITGTELGVTAPDDPTRSPGGRRLIGKIGIGLFSVSQLTHTFQIITKVKGDDHRTVATVALKQYSDDEIPEEDSGDGKFESGKVNIWREKASDYNSHGTTIVLTHIRQQARDTLRSSEIWSAIEHNKAQADSEEKQSIEPPRFHIGRVDKSGELLEGATGKMWSLAWDKGDAPDLAFQKLVDSVWDEATHATPTPKLDLIFDYYLRMVWQISLAIPLPYVDGHIFDMDLGDWAHAFMLSNTPKGTAKRLEARGTPLRKVADLHDPIGPLGNFDVFFDSLKLARPLKFKNLPATKNALKQPIVFVGKCREEFSKVPRALSGGPLAFEAYLFWTPRVAPVEHQGALIRIHGSSGTLFDPTFMRYQVSELTRLRQITCEIFVSEGLDSALNIDRESFNSAHPHSVYITRWLHSALRQLASAQKRLSSDIRNKARDATKETLISGIQRVAENVWKRESDDPGAEPPSIELVTEVKPKISGEAYLFRRDAIVPPKQRTQTAKAKATDAVQHEKFKAIAQVLAAFGLLDNLPQIKQEQLLRAIYEILDAPEE